MSDTECAITLTVDGDGWWDTGHTSTACGCNHHWDAHTPFRGCSVCSCKKDPPNQPPPPPVAEGVVLLDGKRWRVIPTGFGYDDGSQSCRLVPTEGPEADPGCSCENPKPGAHAQSCPRFGMNP